jgi:hypothetical protein
MAKPAGSEELYFLGYNVAWPIEGVVSLYNKIEMQLVRASLKRRAVLS